MFDGPEYSSQLRARLEVGLRRAHVKTMRDQFREMNPHLVGDTVFEDRWRAERKNAAVLIPIIPRMDGARVLLTVRSSDMPSHAGQISLPGGKVDGRDADRKATALREAHEEVNIAPSSVEVIGELGVHYGGMGYAVTPVIGLVDPNAALRACPREVSEIFEAPLAHLADFSNHIIEERRHMGVAHNIYAVSFNGYDIWGLTAGILRNLAEVMRAGGGHHDA